MKTTSQSWEERFDKIKIVPKLVLTLMAVQGSLFNEFGSMNPSASSDIDKWFIETDKELKSFISSLLEEVVRDIVGEEIMKEETTIGFKLCRQQIINRAKDKWGINIKE